MQKMLRHILAVAGRVFFIGFSVQIVLGLLWMICNFPKTGWPLVLVQLVVAFLAAYRLLCVTTKSGKSFRIWGSLALLTFPMAMQTHMGAFPESLAGSCLLLELAFVAEILQGGREVRYRKFFYLLLFWFAGAMLQSEYLYFGAAPAVIICVYAMAGARKQNVQKSIKKENTQTGNVQTKNVQGVAKKAAYYVILFAAALGLILGCRSLSKIGKSEEVSYKSVSLSIASRFAWPRIWQGCDLWPDEIWEYFSEEQAKRTDYYADYVETLLGKTLVDAVGKERADEWFTEIARASWWRYKVNIVHDTAWDVLGYTFSPLVVPRQLTGKVYDSYTGRNYDAFRMETPLLAKYYLNYGCWWFAFGLVLAMGLSCVLAMQYVIGHIRRRRGESKQCSKMTAGTKVIPTVLVYALTAGVMVAFYTLRGAGMMDYKKTFVVGILWILWMLVMCTESLTTENAGSEKVV